MARTHVKLNNELARPIGIVDGTRPGGGTRTPRTHSARTDVTIIRADGTTTVLPARAHRDYSTRAPRVPVDPEMARQAAEDRARARGATVRGTYSASTLLHNAGVNSDGRLTY